MSSVRDPYLVGGYSQLVNSPASTAPGTWAMLSPSGVRFEPSPADAIDSFVTTEPPPRRPPPPVTAVEVRPSAGGNASSNGVPADSFARQGYTYDAILFGPQVANLTHTQLERGVHCQIVLTREVGPALGAPPPLEPRFAPLCVSPTLHSLSNEGIPITFDPLTTAVVNIGGRDVDIMQQEVQDILLGGTGWELAIRGWAAMSARSIGYRFRPQADHRNTWDFLDESIPVVSLGMATPTVSADAGMLLRYAARGQSANFAMGIVFGRADLLSEVKTVVRSHKFFRAIDLVTTVHMMANAAALDEPAPWVKGRLDALIYRLAGLLSSYMQFSDPGNNASFRDDMDTLVGMLSHLPQPMPPATLESSYAGRRLGIVLGTIVGGALLCSEAFGQHDKKRNDAILTVVDLAAIALAAAAGPAGSLVFAAATLAKARFSEVLVERNFAHAVQQMRSRLLMDLRDAEATARREGASPEVDITEAISWLDIAIHACGQA